MCDTIPWGQDLDPNRASGLKRSLRHFLRTILLCFSSTDQVYLWSVLEIMAASPIVIYPNRRDSIHHSDAFQRAGNDSFEFTSFNNGSFRLILLENPLFASQMQRHIEPTQPVLPSVSERSIAQTDMGKATSIHKREDYEARTAFDSIRDLSSPIRNALRRRFDYKSWRFGLFAGLYTSVAVLLSNLALLLYGSFANGGIVNGIGTISKGDAPSIDRLSTGYQIFIYLLSAILLTLSKIPCFYQPSKYYSPNIKQLCYAASLLTDKEGD